MNDKEFVNQCFLDQDFPSHPRKIIGYEKDNKTGKEKPIWKFIYDESEFSIRFKDGVREIFVPLNILTIFLLSIKYAWL